MASKRTGSLDSYPLRTENQQMNQLPEQRPGSPKPNFQHLQRHALPGSAITVPTIGISASLPDNCQYSKQELKNTGAGHFASALGSSLLDYRFVANSQPTINEAADAGKPVGQLFSESDKEQLIVRVGLSPGQQSEETLHTELFSYEGVLQAYQHVRKLLPDRKPDFLVLEGTASLFNTELQNELYFSIAMQGALQAMQELRAARDVSCIGLAADHAHYLQRALQQGDWDVFILNHRYTLLEQWPLFNLLPECQQTATTVMVGHPFNTGILRGLNKWNFASPADFVTARVENIRHICRLHEVPVEAAALQFPVAHPAISTVLVNTDVTQAKQIQQWQSLPIPESLWGDLKLGGVLHEEAPVPAHQSGG